MIPLLIWFVLVQPKDITPFGTTAFRIHSNLALVFVSITLLWFADYMRRGLAGRPGPRLPHWAKTVHKIMHHTIIWGLMLVALTGFLLGLTSAVLLKAGGFLPIAPPLNYRHWNEAIGAFHTVEFYALAGLIVVHAGFHAWRHFVLRDNALRIMAPKRWFKYL
ncbi:MAG: cytochrome b/b6 domain-containing protein [Pseudomonadota bacterium]